MFRPGRLFRTILHAISCLISEITRLPLFTFVPLHLHLHPQHEIARFPFLSPFILLSTPTTYFQNALYARANSDKYFLNKNRMEYYTSREYMPLIITYFEILRRYIWSNITKSYSIHYIYARIRKMQLILMAKMENNV